MVEVNDVNGRPFYTIRRHLDKSVTSVTTIYPDEVLNLLINLPKTGALRRVDIVIVSKNERDGHAVLEEVIETFPDELFRSPNWQELCLIAVKGSGSAVRRFYADGTERYDRRDVTIDCPANGLGPFNAIRFQATLK